MPNKSGARGIHTAASKGHVAVVNSLIVKGENVDAATNVSLKQNEEERQNSFTTHYSLSPFCPSLDERIKTKLFMISWQIIQKAYC